MDFNFNFWCWKGPALWRRKKDRFWLDEFLAGKQVLGSRLLRSWCNKNRKKKRLLSDLMVVFRPRMKVEIILIFVCIVLNCLRTYITWNSLRNRLFHVSVKPRNFHTQSGTPAVYCGGVHGAVYCPLRLSQSTGWTIQNLEPRCFLLRISEIFKMS